MTTVYIATYTGKGKLFNAVLRWLDNTPYSHTEIALLPQPGGLWLCASSSIMDGGARFKAIDIHSGNWDLIPFEVTKEQYRDMMDLCTEKVSRGVKYDYLGLLGAGLIGIRQDKRKEFCNEFVGHVMALVFDIHDPHRLRPASFHYQMKAIQSALQHKGGGGE
jgi:hypothetical protein